MKANKAARQSALDHNAALQQQTLGAKAASAGMGMLKGVLNTLAFTAIATAVSAMAEAIITKITEVVNAYENGIKKINDLTDEVKSLKNEHSSLNDELKTSQERLYELQQIKMPTLFEKDEIENLKEYNEQLELQIRLKELEIKQKNKEVNETAQKLYKGSQIDYNSLDDFFTEDFEWWEHILNTTSHGWYQRGKNTLQNVTNWIQGNTQEQQDAYVKESEDSLKHLEEAKQALDNYQSVIANLNDFKIFSKDKDPASITADDIYRIFGDDILDKTGASLEEFVKYLGALSSEGYEDKHVSYLQNNVENAQKNFDEHIQNLQTRLSEAQTQRLALDPNDKSNANTIAALDSFISQAEAVIYSETRYKNFTDVYNSADFSGTVTKIENLAKAGKLTEETFNKVEGIDKFKEALEGVGETDIAYIITSIIAKVNESEAAFRNAVVGVDAYSEAIEKVGTVINGKNTFDNATDKIKGGENLSYDEVQGLIALNPSIAQDITKTADGYVIAVDKIIAARDEYVKENGVDFINGEVDSVNTSIAEAEATIAEYSKEKAKIYEELFANKDNAQYDRDSAYTRIAEIDNRIKELTDSIQDGENAIAGYNLSLDELAGKSDTTKTYAQIVSGVEEVTSKLKSLANVYNDVKNAESFDWSSVLNNEEFKKTFAGCGETYTQFIETVTQSPDDIEACQSAFNNLAGEYINASGVLNDLTDDTRDAAVAMLEEGGIVNAAEIVDAKLLELINEKIKFNATKIEIKDDINNLIALAEEANATKETINQLKRAKRVIGEDIDQNLYDYGKSIAENKNGIHISGAYDAKAFEYYQNYKALLETQAGNLDFDPKEFEIPEYNYDGTKVDTGSGSSSSQEDSKKTFDWIEKAIEKVQKAAAKLSNVAKSVYKTLTTRNNALTEQVRTINKEIALQEKAYTAYMKKANSVGLSAELMEKVQNGAIDISEYDSETAEIIEKYQEWYENAPLSGNGWRYSI